MITRVSDAQMNALNAPTGAIVYNKKTNERLFVLAKGEGEAVVDAIISTEGNKSVRRKAPIGEWWVVTQRGMAHSEALPASLLAPRPQRSPRRFRLLRRAIWSWWRRPGVFQALAGWIRKRDGVDLALFIIMGTASLLVFGIVAVSAYAEILKAKHPEAWIAEQEFDERLADKERTIKAQKLLIKQLEVESRD